MNFFRRSLLACAALILLLGGWGRARAAEVIPAVPSAYFNDYAGLTSPATAQALNAKLEQFERDTSSQILVVIYPHMQSDSSIEDYTVRVAKAWGVGQKGRNNGAVLFVFSQDHTLNISTGYGLEGALPDALCKRIIDEQIVPLFQKGDFDGAMQAGVDALIAASRGEYQGNGATAADSGSTGSSFDLFRILVILVFLLGWSFLRSRQHVVYQGNGRSSAWSGVPWFILGALSGGGGGGGGFGGGGGSGGGFSGGGGSFGGGGASGRW